MYNVTHYLNIVSSSAAVSASTAAPISMATVVGSLAAFPLGIVAITTGVIGIVSSNVGKLVLAKTEKHGRIKCCLVSKALTDGKVSNEELILSYTF